MPCSGEWFNLVAGFTSTCGAAVSAVLADYQDAPVATGIEEGFFVVSGVTWFASALKGLVDCYARIAQEQNPRVNLRDVDEVRIEIAELEATLRLQVGQLQSRLDAARI
jgi:hypothetical protein